MQKKLIASQALLRDLRRVAHVLKSNAISCDQYNDHGCYSHVTLCRRFGSWKAALQRVGLQPSHWMNIPAETLLEDIRRVARQLEVDRLRIYQYLELGNYSRKIIERHFKRWHTAVLAAGLSPVTRSRTLRPHRTPRTINTRLRFAVFQRDYFKCIACGRSPATDPTVILQVDHKKSWDAGGESVIDNLQTLCSTCNYGKSNLLLMP